MPLNKVDLRDFPNKIFIETGTYRGDGCQKAIESGFQLVHSIEIFEPLYLESMKRFVNDGRVKIWHGDSAMVLKQILDTLKDPATFWLDSHKSGPDSGFHPDHPVPLFAELDIIHKHCQQNPTIKHKILVDDVRLFKSWGFEMCHVIEKLLLICPDYQFSLVNGQVDKDVLIAIPPQ